MTTNPQPNPFLTIQGFQQASTPMAQRLILNIQGLEKTGKTHLAFTSTPPLAYISIDRGEEGVIQKFQYNQSIAQCSVTYDPTGGGEQARNLWEWLKPTLRACFQVNQGTLIVDTTTEMWELLRLARFGKLAQVQSYHYGPVNAEMQEVIRWAYDARNMTTILLHKMGTVFDGGGAIERKGFNQMGYLTQCNVQTFRKDAPEGGSSFGLQIIDSRIAPQLNGYVLEGEQCTVPWLLHYTYGGQ